MLLNIKHFTVNMNNSMEEASGGLGVAACDRPWGQECPPAPLQQRPLEHTLRPFTRFVKTYPSASCAKIHSATPTLSAVPHTAGCMSSQRAFAYLGLEGKEQLRLPLTAQQWPKPSPKLLVPTAPGWVTLHPRWSLLPPTLLTKLWGSICAGSAP